MSVLLSHRRSLPNTSFFIATACLLGLAIALLPQSQLIILAAVVVVLFAIIAIFAEPMLGLALALIAGPFQPLERISLQLPIDSGQVVLAITFVAYGFRWLATRPRRSKILDRVGLQKAPISDLRSPITYALSAFIAVSLLSFLPARDFTDWANESLKWIQILLVYLLVANERDSRRRALFIGAVLVAAAGQAIYGIIQSDVRGFGPREFRVLGSEGGFRAYGTFEQPNPFGGYMGLTWPVAAMIALFTIYDSRFAIGDWLQGRPMRSTIENRKSKILIGFAAAVVAALCFIALVESGSRGALIGAGGAIFAMVLVLLKHPWRWMGVALLLALALLAFDVVSIPASLEAQVQELSAIDVRNAFVTPITFSTIERLAHWQAAIRMIESSPWLGVGFGNYAAAYPDFRLLPWENALGHAHNYYLNIFAETGALGFLAYVALWITIIIVTIRAARKSAISNLQSAICVGILGAWAHLTVHHIFDNLYVANMHVLIGVYLGFVASAGSSQASASQPDTALEIQLSSST